MGNRTSHPVPPQYERVYRNLILIQNPAKRMETIQTLLAAPDIVYYAKLTGIYSHLIQYVGQAQNGRQPSPLPGETQGQQSPQSQQAPTSYALTQHNQAPHRSHEHHYEHLSETAQNDKALSYFQACLQVLNLEEEVALTEDALKTAYKKAAFKAHPDKGGSEKAFEMVTRSYAYLSEILRRIRGGRDQLKQVEAPTALKDERFKESQQFQQVQPVKLDPNNLNMNAFNQMFEQTRIPDPEEEGYGDWLRAESTSTTTPNFSGKFNRDVFNQMFVDESAKQKQSNNQLAIASPQALTMNPGFGIELGRGRPDDYTAAANSHLKYVDLKAAYSTESTFSGQVANVRVDPRDYDSYSNSRKRAPDPLRDEEREAIALAEKAISDRERQRQVRAAHEDVTANQYFERMKQLVITDGVPIGKTKRT
jgi:curved DNA-binding protein CbpA